MKLLPNSNGSSSNAGTALAFRAAETLPLPVIDVSSEETGYVPWSWEHKFAVPTDEDFEGRDFLIAPELKRIALALSEKYNADFPFFNRFSIAFLWKRAGGGTSGKVTLGKCVKLSGLAKFFSEQITENAEESAIDFSRFDFVIWVAADHARLWQPSWKQITALVFHELLHVDSEDSKPKTRGHDFEGFAREIEEFGIWRRDIDRICAAFRQVDPDQGALF